jgi:hypothetical protein
VHLQAGVPADEDARRASVVQVDVAEQEVAEVRKGQAAPAESFFELSNTSGRAAVVEGEAVGGLDEITADDALGALVVEVDRLERVHRPILR